MRPCCPAGRGCNAVDRDEVCALTLCRAFSADEPAAALAVERWEAFEEVSEHRPGSPAEQRFRRRTYERVRDRALVAITMRAGFALSRARAARRAERGRQGLNGEEAAALRIARADYGMCDGRAAGQDRRLHDREGASGQATATS